MTALLEKAYSPLHFRAAGHALVDQLADYLESVGEVSASSATSPESMLEILRPLLDKDSSPEELFELLLKHSIHLHSPNYMGHQVTPPAPLTALADLSSGIVNGSTAIFEMGTVGVVMERLVMERFAQLLGLAGTAGGFMTNGGTLANLTALLAARAAKWPEGDPWREGNNHLRPCVLVNEQAHYCIDRAVRIMGWGEEGIVNIPSDANFRMKTELLETTLAELVEAGRTPIAIVGSAGTTSTGSFDDLQAIAAVAQSYHLWFHVDGAHGVPNRLDPDRKHYLDGLELADSMVMDFHKMMMTPSLTTGLFFREGNEAYRTFHQKADYLLTFDSGAEEWYNMGRRSFECTKNMMGVRVFALLSTYGPQLFRDYVMAVNSNAAFFADLVRRNIDLELAMWPQTNIVCFRYFPKTVGLGADQLNDLNIMIRAQVIAETDFYIVQTKLGGLTHLRCTFTNPMTTEKHLSKLLQSVAQIGTSLVAMRNILP